MREPGLSGTVAVVTGATRGCGRAIAVELGRLGSTVFVTGRTTRSSTSPMGRPETIEGTADLVDDAGGRGIPVRCDFTSVAEVDALRERIESEVEGRLDILVDAVGASAQVDFAVSETPTYLARGVAALALDPHVSRFAGRTLASWTLMHEYGFTDSEGTRPDWGRWFTEVRSAGLDPATTDPTPYR